MGTDGGMLDFFDKGLDEAAAGAHASTAGRMAAALAVGLLSLAFLPPLVCAGWVAIVSVIDIVSWFLTRDQYLGREIQVADRLKHVACLVGGMAAWVAQGAMLWCSGTAAGGACAVAIWLGVMGFAQVYAYQSRAGYIIAGAVPAVGMLLTTLIFPNRAIPGSFFVWLMLLVSVAFSVSGARQTMAARRRYDQATEDLRESELGYRLLADNVTDVISLESADNRRLYVSPSIDRILHFEPGELLTTPNYTYMHPDDAERVRAIINAVNVETGPITSEYRVFTKEGDTIWAETTFSRLSDGSGRLLGVSRDVTARRQLEDDLRDALARSEAAAAAKTDFLANMTHELRTPLTAILGFSGILRQSTALSGVDARQVGLIHDASQTLLGVIGDILDFSKLEAGGLELDPEPFDPAAIARSAAAIVVDQAGAKGLDLTTLIETDSVDGCMPALVGDAPRLRQVLLNFLSNAIKFTRKGGIELALTHVIDGERCTLRIEVRDTGIGIDAAHIDSLFMRFTQADASVSRKFGGTGLGLAISKQIIEAMGGRIGADSVVGQGSTFWFEVDLPLAGELAAASAEPARPAVIPDRPIRVLAVEDNPVNRELIAALLSPFDIELETAADGAEAVEAVGRASFDVILMDVQMPIMDGLTATRRIRALPGPAARTPIVAMTANVLPEQIARCREAGMDDHLGKPINPTKLLEALERWTSEDQETVPSEATNSA
jgi:PAS domain S-box-containing protein